MLSGGPRGSGKGEGGGSVALRGVQSNDPSARKPSERELITCVIKKRMSL